MTKLDGDKMNTHLCYLLRMLSDCIPKDNMMHWADDEYNAVCKMLRAKLLFEAQNYENTLPKEYKKKIC